MSRSRKTTSAKPTDIYDRVRAILESARTRVSRTVNTTQVVANWLIGREIVEEEQRGKKRAQYGEELLENLAERLRSAGGDVRYAELASPHGHDAFLADADDLVPLMAPLLEAEAVAVGGHA